MDENRSKRRTETLMITATVLCLALNIYFEARNQPIVGQIGVAQVVLNRVDSEHYPNTICEVIKDAEYYDNGKLKKHRCQFSWFCDGKSDHPEDIDAFRWALIVAEIVLEGEVHDFIGDATHFHAAHINPEWASRAEHIVTVGDHLFYRFKKSKIKQ